MPNSKDIAPPAPAGKVARQPDWAKTGPAGERANLRLAHTPEGSIWRELHAADHKDWFPPLAYMRMGGTEVTEFALPTLDDGTADGELQRAGFFSPYADRIARRSPHYVLISRRGESL